MSSRVDSLVSSITQLLQEVSIPTGEPRRVSTPPSAVAQDNPYRPYLESIRNDLFHYDSEKKVRILFTINKLAQKHPEDKELIAVLERVEQVVEAFQKRSEIPVSPAKAPTAANTSPPKVAPITLFRDLEEMMGDS